MKPLLAVVMLLSLVMPAGAGTRYVMTNGVVEAVADDKPAEVVMVANEVRTRTVMVRECYTDENGFQRCRMVPRTETYYVPATAAKPAVVPANSVENSAAAVATSDCPCVAATGSCPCSGAVAASHAFPRLRQARASFGGWFSQRPRLFSGRLRSLLGLDD